ncbi:MAG: protein translocase subunit SecA-like protein [Amphiamblys sp. WSBS2006]|nr:MAG: protein translocase subunit SecA-like protein [Amphiamblys sp. WSBS2006]
MVADGFSVLVAQKKEEEAIVPAQETEEDISFDKEMDEIMEKEEQDGQFDEGTIEDGVVLNCSSGRTYVQRLLDNKNAGDLDVCREKIQWNLKAISKDIAEGREHEEETVEKLLLVLKDIDLAKLKTDASAGDGGNVFTDLQKRIPEVLLQLWKAGCLSGRKQELLDLFEKEADLWLDGCTMQIMNELLAGNSKEERVSGLASKIFYHASANHRALLENEKLAREWLFFLWSTKPELKKETLAMACDIGDRFCDGNEEICDGALRIINRGLDADSPEEDVAKATGLLTRQIQERPTMTGVFSQSIRKLAANGLLKMIGKGLFTLPLCVSRRPSFPDTEAGSVSSSRDQGPGHSEMGVSPEKGRQEETFREKYKEVFACMDLPDTDAFHGKRVAIVKTMRRLLRAESGELDLIQMMQGRQITAKLGEIGRRVETFPASEGLRPFQIFESIESLVTEGWLLLEDIGKFFHLLTIGPGNLLRELLYTGRALRMSLKIKEAMLEKNTRAEDNHAEAAQDTISETLATEEELEEKAAQDTDEQQSTGKIPELEKIIIRAIYILKDEPSCLFYFHWAFLKLKFEPRDVGIDEKTTQAIGKIAGLSSDLAVMFSTIVDPETNPDDIIAVFDFIDEMKVGKDYVERVLVRRLLGGASIKDWKRGIAEDIAWKLLGEKLEFQTEPKKVCQYIKKAILDFSVPVDVGEKVVVYTEHPWGEYEEIVQAMQKMFLGGLKVDSAVKLLRLLKQFSLADCGSLLETIHDHRSWADQAVIEIVEKSAPDQITKAQFLQRHNRLVLQETARAGEEGMEAAVEKIFPHDDKNRKELKEHYAKVLACDKKNIGWVPFRTSLAKLSTKENFQAWRRVLDCSEIHEILFVVLRAVEVASGEREIRPNTVQVLCIIISTIMADEQKGGVLSQMQTGEGKTLVVACIAAVRVLQGHTVDIITSSSELIREVPAEQKGFFEILGISVDTMFTKDQTGDLASELVGVKKEASKYRCDVLYGTASVFEGDILREEYKQESIREGRKFDVVIVDEADNLLLDSKDWVTMLSSPINGFCVFYALHTAIWDYVELLNKHLTTKDMLFCYQDPSGEVTVIAQLDQDDAAEKIEQFYTSSIKHQVQSLIREDPEQNGRAVISVPRCFREFLVQGHIGRWADMALQAKLGSEENVNYIVDTRKGKVIPVDNKNTGVKQQNMRWSNGLHQFLELRHRTELSEETLSNNFLSNVSFFLRYKELCGLTGTLGGQEAIDLMKKTYRIQTAIIPPSKEKRHIRLQPCIEGSHERWALRILQKTLGQIRQQRPVLIIVEDIKTATQMSKRITEYFAQMTEVVDLRLYISEEETEHVQQRKIGHNTAIIATNIAGRGTNLVIDAEIEKAGGLHVIVGFIPESERVLQQNAGRASRQGQRGTSQLIVHDHMQRTFDEMMQKRQQGERELLRSAEKDIKRTIHRDRLFQDFLCFRKDKRGEIANRVGYTELYSVCLRLWERRDQDVPRNLAGYMGIVNPTADEVNSAPTADEVDIPDHFDEIYMLKKDDELKAIEQRFAMWISQRGAEDGEKEDAFESFKKQIEKETEESIIDSPFVYNELGIKIMEKGSSYLWFAIVFFRKAVEVDPVFNGNAYYNMGYCKLLHSPQKQDVWTQAGKDLRNASLEIEYHKARISAIPKETEGRTMLKKQVEETLILLGVAEGCIQSAAGIGKQQVEEQIRGQMEEKTRLQIHQELLVLNEKKYRLQKLPECIETSPDQTKEKIGKINTDIAEQIKKKEGIKICKLEQEKKEMEAQNNSLDSQIAEKNGEVSKKRKEELELKTKLTEASKDLAEYEKQAMEQLGEAQKQKELDLLAVKKSIEKAKRMAEKFRASTEDAEEEGKLSAEQHVMQRISSGEERNFVDGIELADLEKEEKQVAKELEDAQTVKKEQESETTVENGKEKTTTRVQDPFLDCDILRKKHRHDLIRGRYWRAGWTKRGSPRTRRLQRSEWWFLLYSRSTRNARRNSLTPRWPSKT